MVICLLFFAFLLIEEAHRIIIGKRTGSKRTGNIATGNVAGVVNELRRSVALIAFRH